MLTTALWTLGGLVALFVLFLLLMAALGARLPVEHVASRSLRLRQPPEAVWALVSDAGSHPAWAAGVARVERLPDRNGHEAWRQHMGRNSFVLETTESDPPRRLVRTIGDDHTMFSGSWTYEIARDADGCTVRLTERGRVSNPMARGMMHYVFGEETYLKKHLASIARKFGEPCRLES
jgi:uncharacterized protein YndB with AHSA1/START domain